MVNKILKNTFFQNLLLFPVIFMLLALGSPKTYGMENVPKRPENYVYDPSGYLKPKTYKAIQLYGEETNTNFGVYIDDSFEGESIENVTSKITQEWNIGEGTNTNSVLIVFSILDEKMRLSMSDTISQKLTLEDAEDVFLSNRTFIRDEDYDKAILHMLKDFKEIEQKNEEYQNTTNLSATYSTNLPPAIRLSSTLSSDNITNKKQSNVMVMSVITFSILTIISVIASIVITKREAK